MQQFRPQPPLFSFHPPFQSMTWWNWILLWCVCTSLGCWPTARETTARAHTHREETICCDRASLASTPATPPPSPAAGPSECGLALHGLESLPVVVHRSVQREKTCCEIFQFSSSSQIVSKKNKIIKSVRTKWQQLKSWVNENLLCSSFL